MSAATDAVFPVDTFRDAAPHLRRPFTAEAVKFKVQATWPKGKPTGGLIVAYIDARLAVERLNLVVPHLWHDAYRPVGSGQMWCDLTIDGITRSDVGEGTGKGLVSDALKRAAVRFGVGVSLYAIPKMTLDVSAGTLKEARDSLALTAKGETVLRNMYAHWLAEHGAVAFGDPLDHGDVAGAAGDHEADDHDSAPPPGVDPGTGEVTPVSPASPVWTSAHEDAWSAVKLAVKAGVTTKQAGAAIIAAGAPAEAVTSLKMGVAALSEDQAITLEARVTKPVAEVAS